MKLNAIQIGLLAVLIEAALKNHPIVPMTEEELTDVAMGNKMEDWEVALKTSIDAESRLPSYEKMCEDGELNSLIETLVYYFPSEQTTTQNNKVN